MREQLIEELQKIEANMEVYYRYTKDPAVERKNKSVVSFKLLNDLLAFEAIRKFVPDYKQSENTGTMLAQGLNQVVKFVSVVEGQVVISPEYDAVLKEAAKTK